MTGSTHEPEVHNFCLKVGNVLKAVVAGTDSDRRLSTDPEVQDCSLDGVKW